ncbi:MAG: hypothetical protein GY725_19330 [bacterium]|nr:hypothetical protein [bacterium]
MTEGVFSEHDLVEEYTPDRYELAVLARHYLDTAAYILHAETALGGAGSWPQMESFAWNRLATIKEHIGEQELEKALEKTRQFWEAEFDELAKIPRCGNCDARHGPHCIDGSGAHLLPIPSHPSSSGAFLSAGDLVGEGEKSCRITGVQSSIGAAEGLSVSVSGHNKPIRLEPTNVEWVATCFGENRDKWVGKIIQLWRSKTEINEEKIPCITVRVPTPRETGEPWE